MHKLLVVPLFLIAGLVNASPSVETIQADPVATAENKEELSFSYFEAGMGQFITIPIAKSEPDTSITDNFYDSTINAEGNLVYIY